MSKRLIIEYPEDMDTRDAVLAAERVVREGRISEARGRKQFCFVTCLDNNDNGKSIIVQARERRTDTAAESLEIRWDCTNRGNDGS